MDAFINRKATQRLYNKGGYPSEEAWGFFKEDVSPAFWEWISTVTIDSEDTEIQFYSTLERCSERALFLLEIDNDYVACFQTKFLQILHEYLTCQEKSDALVSYFHRQYGLNLHIFCKYLKPRYDEWQRHQFDSVGPTIPDFDVLKIQYISLDDDDDCDWYIDDFNGVQVDRNGESLHPECVDVEMTPSNEYDPRSLTPDYNPDELPPSQETSYRQEIAAEAVPSGSPALQEDLPAVAEGSCAVDQCGGDAPRPLHGGERKIFFTQPESIFHLGSTRDWDQVMEFMSAWPLDLHNAPMSEVPNVPPVPRELKTMNYNQVHDYIVLQIRKSRRKHSGQGKFRKVISNQTRERDEEESHPYRRKTRSQMVDKGGQPPPPAE